MLGVVLKYETSTVMMLIESGKHAGNLWEYGYVLTRKTITQD